MEPKVSIIVLNWNNWPDTIECLESLFQINYSNYDVILVDNGSDDDSIERIKDYSNGKLEVKSDFFEYDHTNKPLKLIELEEDQFENIKSDNYSNSEKNLFIIKNQENYGFAEGNNIGIDFSLKILKPDFVQLLNNDIVVSKNFLTELINVIKSDDNIAIVGPKNYYYDFEGRKDVETAMGGYINWLSYPGYHYLEESLEDEESPIELDWITGASLLIRADLPNIFLGKEFFFGAEDIDLCTRFKEEGYKILLVPTSEIWHKISTSRYKKFNNYFKIFKNNFASHYNLVKKHQRFYHPFIILYIIQMTFIYYPKKIINKELSK